MMNRQTGRGILLLMPILLSILALPSWALPPNPSSYTWVDDYQFESSNYAVYGSAYASLGYSVGDFCFPFGPACDQKVTVSVTEEEGFSASFTVGIGEASGTYQYAVSKSQCLTADCDPPAGQTCQVWYCLDNAKFRHWNGIRIYGGYWTTDVSREEITGGTPHIRTTCEPTSAPGILDPMSSPLFDQCSCDYVTIAVDLNHFLDVKSGTPPPGHPVNNPHGYYANLNSWQKDQINLTALEASEQLGMPVNEVAVFDVDSTLTIVPVNRHPGEMEKYGRLETRTPLGGNDFPFGGAMWAADSMRWEAVSGGTWTFDSGIGSDFVGATTNPDVDPDKSAGLHATMEGWTGVDRAGCGGDWSDMRHLADLPPPVTDCECALSDTVLCFQSLANGGHDLYQDNIVVSPWIDLARAGVGPLARSALEFDLYADMPVENDIFLQVYAQWAPVSLSDPATKSLQSKRYLYYFGSPACTDGSSTFRVDLTDMVPSYAEEVRIGLGIVSMCATSPTCTGVSNASPYLDNIRFIATQGTDAPLAVRDEDLPQDTFPANGTLRIDAPGRLDQARIVSSGASRIGSIAGDTLVVHSPGDNVEVRVNFAVDPGPGINASRLSSWLNSHQFEGINWGLSWFSARMDTAEKAGTSALGAWMTAYHEDDPNFSGTDEDVDPNDMGSGSQSHLANDIFPDDLFTPGSSVFMFYSSRHLPGSSKTIYPDTTGGTVLEMEVLPSSMRSDSTWNCVLYVNHFDKEIEQEMRDQIDLSLLSLLGPGNGAPQGKGKLKKTGIAVLPGGGNYDRFDVRVPDSRQASFGRPLQTEYGASVVQALGYKAIIWDSGDLPSYCLTKDDTDILVPWLTLQDIGGNNLFLAGDNLAENLVSPANPAGATLLNDLGGAQVTCTDVASAGCPPASPAHSGDCIDILAAPGAAVAMHDGLGAGLACPLKRRFSVLAPYPGAQGSPAGDEEYDSPNKGTVPYASVTNQVSTPQLDYRTVIDGVSLRHRKPTGGCAVEGDLTAIENRLSDVLTWFGYDSASSCVDPTIGTGIMETHEPTLPVTRMSVYPNPLRLGAGGQIALKSTGDEPVVLTLHDVQGRLVRSIFSGQIPNGALRFEMPERDDAGARLRSGMYLLKARAGERITTRKVVVLP